MSTLEKRWPAWRPMTETPPVATPVLITCADEDGERYVELAECSGRPPRWMLVGGDPMPAHVYAWMPCPRPFDLKNEPTAREKVSRWVCTALTYPVITGMIVAAGAVT